MTSDHITPTAARITPPFTLETARAKVKAAENAWNSRDPEIVAQAYTEDSDWRNLAEPNGILQGPGGYQVVPEAEVAEGTGLSPDEGALVLHWKSNLGTLRVRVARRGRTVVSHSRKRALGVRQ